MKNKQQLYYKIVELKNNKIKTLFHGINRNKELKMNEWLTADLKMVSDGGTKYLSGFHIMTSINSCNAYLQRFKRPRILKIVKCKADGIWKKEHSPSNVFLAKQIFITEIIK